jgi:hypothetical protein
MGANFVPCRVRWRMHCECGGRTVFVRAIGAGAVCLGWAHCLGNVREEAGRRDILPLGRGGDDESFCGESLLARRHHKLEEGTVIGLGDDAIRTAFPLAISNPCALCLHPILFPPRPMPKHPTRPSPRSGLSIALLSYIVVRVEEAPVQQA